MNNNVLVIHPDDGSVGYDIYQYLYDGLGYDIISDASISDSELRASIAEHETIIINGCFTNEGMVVFSKTEHIVSTSSMTLILPSYRTSESYRLVVEDSLSKTKSQAYI